MLGKIYSIVSGKYHIKCKEDDSLNILPALGVFRHKEITPLVGDYVEFIENEYLTEILPRKNELLRPKVANIDQGIIIMSIEEPKFSSYLIDKYLAILEFNNIKPIIIISKVDLNQKQNLIWKKLYKNLNYEVYDIQNQKIDKIFWKKIFANQTSVLIGQSGVGKTTFLNKLGNYKFKTNEISYALNRGKHTTRVVQINTLLDGEIIDTPGFSSVDLNMFEMTKINLAQSFKIFRENLAKCKYKSCLHFNEPIESCYIKKLVSENKIPKFRYDNYCKLLQEIKDKNE